MLAKEGLDSLIKKIVQLYSIRKSMCEKLEEKLRKLNEEWEIKNQKYQNNKYLSQIVILKRQVQLEEYTYNRIKLESNLQRANMYFDGVLNFYQYIKANIDQNEIECHKYSHLFAQNIREQAIFYCESKIKELKQKNTSRVITNRFLERLNETNEEDPVQYGKTHVNFYKDFHVNKIEEWKNEYKRLTTAFQDRFEIDPTLVRQPTSYLNYEVLEVVKNLYPSYKVLQEEKNKKTKM